MSISRDLRHELRTPLNHIIGYSEMLMEDLAEQNAGQFSAAFASVIEDARTLVKLISNLSNDAPQQPPADGHQANPPERFTQWRNTLDQLGERLVLVRTAAGDNPAWFADLDKVVQATLTLRRLFEDGIKGQELSDPTPVLPVAAAGMHPVGTGGSAGGKSGTLLVVDDNRFNLDLMARRLRRDGFEVTTSDSGKDALALIQAGNFDVILLDWLMPELSGLEVLAQLRSSYSPHELPVIVVTAKHGSENIVEALAAGANDYITKPVDFPVAIARIATQLYLRRVTQELKAANEKLRRFSYVDGLTGIPNRRQLNEFFDAVWADACQQNTEICTIMLDVDHFKAYNDSYGHEAGDQVLIQLAQCLAATVRNPQHLLARYGGEEFAAILPGATLPEALAIAEACRQAIMALNIPHAFHSSERIVTISLGVSTRTPADQQNHDLTNTQLLQRADQALYGSKKGGRNRVAH
jgi:diguanylate cyclase (GGDEF)-like protein